jgi:hypothetical protein
VIFYLASNNTAEGEGLIPPCVPAEQIPTKPYSLYGFKCAAKDVSGYGMIKEREDWREKSN